MLGCHIQQPVGAWCWIQGRVLMPRGGDAGAGFGLLCLCTHPAYPCLSYLPVAPLGYSRRLWPSEELSWGGCPQGAG